MMQLRANTMVFESPLNGAVQTTELPGARWVCEITYDTLSKPDRLLMQAFLSKLRGRAGRVFLWDMSHYKPQGVASGSPLVNGASQTGASLITDGWTISQSPIIKAGDYVGVNNELKRIVADSNSNGSGQSTLTFEPPLRSSPADNAAITTDKPKFTGMLIDDDQDIFTSRTALYTIPDAGITIRFVEAFS
jgi:hypothetical protein